jgi:hypothetical protein
MEVAKGISRFGSIELFCQVFFSSASECHHLHHVLVEYCEP